MKPSEFIHNRRPPTSLARPLAVLTVALLEVVSSVLACSSSTSSGADAGGDGSADIGKDVVEGGSRDAAKDGAKDARRPPDSAHASDGALPS